MSDHIRHITLIHVVLPLANPVSGHGGAHRPAEAATETVLLFAEITTEQGLQGMGFSYSKRAGGRAQFTHLAEVADTAIGADRPTSTASTSRCCGQALRWAGREWPPRRSQPSTSRCGISRRDGPGFPRPSSSAPTATPAASTTPPVASCRHPSRRSKRRPPPRWSPGSAASKSKWGNRTGRWIWIGWRRYACTWATRR